MVCLTDFIVDSVIIYTLSIGAVTNRTYRGLKGRLQTAPTGG